MWTQNGTRIGRFRLRPPSCLFQWQRAARRYYRGRFESAALAPTRRELSQIVDSYLLLQFRDLIHHSEKALLAE